MKQNRHRLLRRQIKKYLPKGIEEDQIGDLLDSIDKAYKGFDEDLNQAELTLELSSQELFRVNEELRKNVATKTEEAEVLTSRIESIVNSVNEILFQADLFGNWTYLNSSWERITGYSVEESLGKSFLSYIHPEDQESSAQYIYEVFQETSENKRATARYLTKDGNIKYAEAYVNLNYDHKGNVIGYSGTLNDITDRYLAQQEITKLALVAKKTDNIVIVSDLEGKITWVNDAFTKLTGYSTDEVIGKKPGDFLQGPETSISTKEAMHNAIANKESYSGEVYNYTKKGLGYWLSISITPMTDESGDVVGFIAIELDVTDKKEREKALKIYAKDLEKTNSELDKFAYIVSHDLKAPLRAINNLSEWIQEDIDHLLEGENKEQMALLRGRVKRMENLINGILQYSKAGRIKAERKDVNVDALVRDIIDSNALPEEAIITISEKLPVCNTEEIALQQIFSNLISNAIKYNDKDQPSVEISFTESNNYYEFCVADNGPGIDEQFHDKIFVIFQTLESRDSRESTGVGLAIVQKIVEDHGGEIRLDSKQNEGSRFYFTWPKF